MVGRSRNGNKVKHFRRFLIRPIVLKPHLLFSSWIDTVVLIFRVLKRRKMEEKFKPTVQRRQI